MKYAQLQVLAIQQDAALQCNIMKRRDAEEPRDGVDLACVALRTHVVSIYDERKQQAVPGMRKRRIPQHQLLLTLQPGKPVAVVTKPLRFLNDARHADADGSRYHDDNNARRKAV